MTNNYDGLPSITLSSRPFFSIIIPCYNSRNTLPDLLDSIIAQNMNGEIEVILSDDHSKESYQDVVDKYKDILSIKQVQTDYNFAPGNTRERGVQYAEGEWITFADHDDEYIPDVFKKVKDLIQEKKIDHMVVGDFYEINPETGETLNELKHSMNWMHGKFYNLDNFWKKHDIHYKKDLLTHEDIQVSSQVCCALAVMNQDPEFTDFPVYIWKNRPTSVSHELYGGRDFLEVFYRDYLESTGYTYYNRLKAGEEEGGEKIDASFIYTSMIDVLLYAYFYLQGIKFRRPKDWLRDNEQHCREYLILIKETFEKTNEMIINDVCLENCRRYTEIREFAYIGTGKYLETETFAQFLDKLHPDIKPLITMSQAMTKGGGMITGY